MVEYIEKKKLVNALKMWLMDLENDMNKGDYGELCENKGAREAVESCICEAEEQPAADVQPVSETENMAIISDEIICKRCGIHIKDYIKVVMDEDNDGYIDEQHYDYEPKFCPECGAKVKED